MSVQFETGAIVGSYRIDGVLAQGGMGVVYRARHIELDRLVALKMIRAEWTFDDDFRQRFRREARLAAKLDHPHIVSPHDFGEDQGALYVVMPLIRGHDLRELIVRDGRLEPARAAALVAQVASALDAAHEQGLVHRDVKPQNVLVVTSGQREDALLTDFGLAKSMVSETHLTRMGQFPGTPGYVSPEQINNRDLDARTDVYALGCVLYEALTGSVPYPKETPALMLVAHLLEPPPRVTAQVEGLPEALDETIQRALAKEPDERFPSAGEFGRAAVAAAAWVPSPTPPTGIAPRPPAAEPQPTPEAEDVPVRAPEVMPDPAPPPEFVLEPEPTPPEPERAPASPTAEPKKSRRPTAAVVAGPSRLIVPGLAMTLVGALIVGVTSRLWDGREILGWAGTALTVAAGVAAVLAILRLARASTRHAALLEPATTFIGGFALGIAAFFGGEWELAPTIIVAVGAALIAVGGLMSTHPSTGSPARWTVGLTLVGLVAVLPTPLLAWILTDSLLDWWIPAAALLAALVVLSALTVLLARARWPAGVGCVAVAAGATALGIVAAIDGAGGYYELSEWRGTGFFIAAIGGAVTVVGGVAIVVRSEHPSTPPDPADGRPPESGFSPQAWPPPAPWPPPPAQDRRD